MTLDQIDQMVRAANPVPDPTALESDDAAPTARGLLPRGALAADLEPSPGDQTGRRARLVAVAAVAAAMLLLAGTVLLADRGDHATRTEPANPNPSTTVLTPSTTIPPPSTTAQVLPEGAPSMPPTGELVAAINIRHRGVYRLYADGRLIDVWNHDEQRLTPEGVERVRSRFLSSGLFDSAQPLSDVDELCAIHACVRDGDHWLDVQVDVGGPSASQAPPEAVGLFDDLVMLDSWLPATEWVDAQVKPYVPALIGTCFSMYVDGALAPFDLAVLLSRLPERAAGVLASHERSAEMESLLVPLTRFSAGVSNAIVPPESGCFELTLDEARTLADASLAPSGRVWFFHLLPDKWPFDAFGD